MITTTLFLLLLTLVLVVGIVLLLHTFLLVITVYGNSMAPTLCPGDRILVLRRLLANHLRRGQVVIVAVPGEQEHLAALDPSAQGYYVKRIVALADTSFSASDRVLYKASLVKEERVQEQQKSWHIPAGHVFVCGDNREKSIDSRVWGPLPLDNVIGVMVMKLASSNISVIGKTDARINRTTSDSPGEAPTQMETLQAGTLAPLFTATTVNGETWELADYAGRSVLLLFIAPNRLIRARMAAYEALARRLSEQRNITTLFACNADLEGTRALVQELDMTFPVLVTPDKTHPLWQAYRVIGTPFYCLIDASGRVESCGFLTASQHSMRATKGSPGVDVSLLSFPETTAR